MGGISAVIDKGAFRPELLHPGLGKVIQVRRGYSGSAHVGRLIQDQGCDLTTLPHIVDFLG